MNKRGTAYIVCLALLLGLAAAGCGEGRSEASPADGTGSGASRGSGYVQGVTDTEILVGNTAVTTGTLGGAGVSFNVGLSAALEAYNNEGGFQGRRVRLINRSDGYDADVGLACTRKLAEEDGVFALVGHFGAPTVSATLDYIREQGIPMVYAAAGVSGLYREKAAGYGEAVFPVQPVYEAEGRALLARALASCAGGFGLGGSKIGVIYAATDEGAGLKAGVELQAQKTDAELVCREAEAPSDYPAAVAALQEAGCDTVILCTGWSALKRAMNAMRDAEYNAKCITFSANASSAIMGELADDGSVTRERPLYAVTWLDTSTEEGVRDYLSFMGVQMAWEEAYGVKAEDSFVRNSYTVAGYIAGTVFTQGLKNLEARGMDLTWENFVRAMETEMDVPMSGTVDYTGGQRRGLSALALCTVDLEIDEWGNHEVVTVSPLMDPEEVWEHVGLTRVSAA